VKIIDILTNFFKSRGYNDLYQEIVGVGQELYIFYRHYGLDGIWTRVWEILEFENDRQAYDVNLIRLDQRKIDLIVLGS
jgi:hypothetical protein